jgi:hypothetical protein
LIGLQLYLSVSKLLMLDLFADSQLVIACLPKVCKVLLLLQLSCLLLLSLLDLVLARARNLLFKLGTLGFLLFEELASFFFSLLHLLGKYLILTVF